MLFISDDLHNHRGFPFDISSHTTGTDFLYLSYCLYHDRVKKCESGIKARDAFFLKPTESTMSSGLDTQGAEKVRTVKVFLFHLK